MNNKTHLQFIGRTIGLCAIVLGAFFVVFGAAHIASANPTTAPGVGSGVISVSGSNVGIGTTTPSAVLTVSGPNGNLLTVNRDNATCGSGINLASLGTTYWTLKDTVGGCGTLGIFSFVNQAGADMMVITQAGSVGIGNVAPAQKLDVTGNANISGTLTAGAFTAIVAAGNISAGTFGSNTGGGNYVFTGNVGIGAAPGQKLTVAGNFSATGGYSTYTSDGLFNVNATPSFINTPSGNKILFGYTDYGLGNYVPRIGFLAATGSGGGNQVGAQASIGLAAPSGDLTFNGGASNSEQMRILLSNGNVGIGTASPSQKLEVAGNVSSTGLCLGGVCQTTWASLGQWNTTGTAIYYNAGNVGIGTATPVAKLDVSGGDMRVTGGIRFNASSYADKELYSPADGLLAWQTHTLAGAHAFEVRDQSNSAIVHLDTNGNTYLNGGNVGIGTATPSTREHVYGTLTVDPAGQALNQYSEGIRIGAASDGFSVVTFGANPAAASGSQANQWWIGKDGRDSGFNVFGASSGDAFHILPSGNVGIGTIAPGYKLDVQGTGNFTQPVIVGAPTAGNMAATKSYVDSAVGTVVSTPLLSALGNYVWTAATLPQGYPLGVQTSFVQASQGFPDYGSVITDDTYSGGGGALQLFTPYGPSNGGTGLKVRFGNDDVNSGNSWTSWKTLLASDNFSNYALPLSGGTITGSLTVNGSGSSFAQPVIVGAPTAGNMAATKSYVDSAVNGGGVGSFSSITVSGGSTLSGAVSMGAGLNFTGGASANITGLTKITVGTVDPVYQIGTVKYATFGPSMASGVTEEVTGDGTLAKSGSDYEYAINFSKIAQGSDLWVWYQAVDFGKSTVQAIATPYGRFAEIYYTINGTTLTFHGDAPAQFSFRLTGKRFDWKNWPTQLQDQSEQPGFVLTAK